MFANGFTLLHSSSAQNEVGIRGEKKHLGGGWEGRMISRSDQEEEEEGGRVGGGRGGGGGGGGRCEENGVLSPDQFVQSDQITPMCPDQCHFHPYPKLLDQQIGVLSEGTYQIESIENIERMGQCFVSPQ